MISLVINTDKCVVHTNCPNGFYLESIVCPTCKVKNLDVDTEFNISDLPLKLECVNCEEVNQITALDVDNFFRLAAFSLS